MLIPASPDVAAALPDVDPLLAWGVLTRGLGVVYAIAFASIAVQIRGLAGRDGGLRRRRLDGLGRLCRM